MKTTRWVAAAAVMAMMPGVAMARPVSANDAMRAAMMTAKAQKKAILVLFGASW